MDTQMDPHIFAQAIGIAEPWFVDSVYLDDDPKIKTLTIRIDFRAGTRFAQNGAEGLHPVHDTLRKQYRHLNFFQYKCIFDVRVPRIRLPDNRVVSVVPPWAGKRSGYTLLFEALVLMLCKETTFAAAGRILGLSRYRAFSICNCYVNLMCEQADLSGVREVAIDETSRAKGHDYITVVADAATRSVIYATAGRGKAAVERFAQYLREHNGDPDKITSVSIDMSEPYIRGVTKHLPNARITFDKFHVIAQASEALNRTRRAEQKVDASLKGMRWTLLKDRKSLSDERRQELDAFIADVAGNRTAKAWLYREQLRAILNRKQINVVDEMLWQWCTNVNRSKVEHMKKVASMIRAHFDGIIAWAQTRQTNGFMEALNGLFQAAKRKARGFRDLGTIRTVLFLIAGKLDFTKINPHARLPLYA